MNYRHAYHAGSFTDVVKHVVLTGLITSLTKKDSPFCYIDTHAGAGCYHLLDINPQKTKEYCDGIQKVIEQDNPPALVETYLHCVRQINQQLSGKAGAALKYYPGSPLIARHLARSNERIIACELHSEEYQALKKTFAKDKQVAIHHLDGFLGLKAFLPPKERRGIVLMDPPYEDPDELTRIARSMPTALKRWQTGVYAIWYPIKEHAPIKRFYQALKATIEQPILAIELTIYPELPHHLNGCGMVIINPPWQFEPTLSPSLAWLWKTLTINGQGGYSTFLIK